MEILCPLITLESNLLPSESFPSGSVSEEVQTEIASVLTGVEGVGDKEFVGCGVLPGIVGEGVLAGVVGVGEVTGDEDEQLGVTSVCPLHDAPFCCRSGC